MKKIKESTERLIAYLSLCVNFVFKDFFKKVDAVFGSIFVTVIFLFIQHYHWFSDSDFKNSLFCIIFGILLLVFIRFSFAPYYVWRKDQDAIYELLKIDKSDLENMLGGRFIFQNTFLYGGDINICKSYVGTKEIMSLNNVYTAVKVRAPKNSLAKIKINTTYCSFCGQCRFYYKSNNKEEFFMDDACDPHGFFDVYIDDNSRFFLKMICDDNITVENDSTLLIEIKSWTK
jgi:hypothetical protein